MSENIHENVVELNEEALAEVAGGKSAKYVLAVADANVRSGPGTEFAVVGHSVAGFSAKYTGEKKKDSKGKTWYRVTWSGKSGWIRSDLVTKP